MPSLNSMVLAREVPLVYEALNYSLRLQRIDNRSISFAFELKTSGCLMDLCSLDCVVSDLHFKVDMFEKSEMSTSQ